MTRSINAQTLSAISGDNFNLATLIHFDFSTDVRITDWARNITAIGNTWTSSGNFLDIDAVTETGELQVNNLNITLSAVEQTYVSIFLAQNYLDIPCNIYRVVLDNTDSVIGAPINIFTGLITGYSIEDSGESSSITVALASHWKDFEKENGRRTNHNSQQLHFAGDEGFEFAAKTIKDLKWGRK